MHADIITASEKQVAGLNATTAKNIVAYREENGAFTSRAQIKKVPKLGPKAFEQCAGFLRVPESKNILDHTGVHPESYDAAGTLLTACGYDLKKAPEGGFKGLKEKAEKLGIAREQVLAMGDSGNDCAMLRYAGVGAAMGNAGEQAKKAADVIAPSNREDGVAWMLRRAARGEI